MSGDQNIFLVPGAGQRHTTLGHGSAGSSLAIQHPPREGVLAVHVAVLVVGVHGVSLPIGRIHRVGLARYIVLIVRRQSQGDRRTTIIIQLFSGSAGPLISYLIGSDRN